MTPTELKKIWKKIPGEHKIIKFNSEYDDELFSCFSNLHIHNTFSFELPSWCGIYGGDKINVESSEKAIMLCKASLMNDPDSFIEILKCSNQHKVKSLGKKIKNFNQELWNEKVCFLTKKIIKKKFSNVKGLKEVLFLTKNHLIAKISPTDKNWGIGMGKDNPDSNYPTLWKGSNILGWALMEVREELLATNIN